MSSRLIPPNTGAIRADRTDLAQYKKDILKFSNANNRQGGLSEVLVGSDVFIGVSKGGLLTKEHVATMADNAIVFAMANPTPEIMPDEAKAGGAAVVGTGRSDFPNQVNNLLAFPGIFRGALDARATRITSKMKMAAAQALADTLPNPSADMVLPGPLDRTVAPIVAAAVGAAWQAE